MRHHVDELMDGRASGDMPTPAEFREAFDADIAARRDPGHPSQRDELAEFVALVLTAIALAVLMAAAQGLFGGTSS